jgi:hypothetical protein
VSWLAKRYWILADAVVYPNLDPKGHGQERHRLYCTHRYLASGHGQERHRLYCGVLWCTGAAWEECSACSAQLVQRLSFASNSTSMDCETGIEDHPSMKGDYPLGSCWEILECKLILRGIFLKEGSAEVTVDPYVREAIDLAAVLMFSNLNGETSCHGKLTSMQN